MATLTNTQISVTYVGLLKTSANTVLSSTAQQITDGSGNNSILFLSTAGVGIGGAAASGKELDVTGNVLVTGDLQVDNLNIDGNTISASSGVVTLANGAIATTQSASDNSTKIATTAYVDNQVTIQDLDFSGTSGTGSVDLDSQVFAITGSSNEIETTASGQGLEIGIVTNPTLTGNVIVTGSLTGTQAVFSSSSTPVIQSSTSSTAENLLLIGTDTSAASAPDLVLYRNAGAPADNDTLGVVEFRGNNAANNGVKSYSGIFSRIIDGSEHKGALTFSVNGTNYTSAMAIHNTGTDEPKVIIGNTDPFAVPTHTLDVDGDASFAGAVFTEFIKSNSSVRIDIDNDNNQTDRAFLISTHNAGTELMRVQEDGKVGIGTVPDNKFHVHGGDASIYAIFARSDSKFMYLHSGATDPAIGFDTGGSLRFGTATSNVGASFSEKMRITNSAEGHIELSGTAPLIKATASNGGSGLRINVAAQSGGNIFRVQENGTTLFQIDDGGPATFAGDVTATSKKFISTSSSSGDYVRLYAGSGTAQWDIYGSRENLRLSENSSGGGIFQVDSGATFGGNVTTTGSTIKVDNTGSASYIVDRGNDTSGATFEYFTNGTIKWFTGLRGVSSDDFFIFNYGTGGNALHIESSNSKANFAGDVTVNGGIIPKYYNVNIDTASGTSSNSNVYLLGRLTLSQSNGCIIKVLGTVSFGAGNDTSGVTYIHIRGNNGATTLDGHFYGFNNNSNRNTIEQVRYVNISSNVFDIYIKYDGTFAGLDTIVETGGIFVPNLTDQGSTSFPTSVAFTSKFAATTAGVQRFSIDGTGNSTFTSTVNIGGNCELGANNINFADGGKARFGNSADLQIDHDGSNSFINNLTGAFILRQSQDDGNLAIQCDDGSGGVTEYYRADGGTEKNVFSKDVTLDNSGSGDRVLTLSTTTGGDPQIVMNSDAANRSGLIKYQDNGTNIGRIEYVHNGDRIDFQAGSSTGATMSIENNAVGIGETNPLSDLTVRSDSSGGRGGEISIVNYASNATGNEAALNFGLESSTYNADLSNAQIKARVNNGATAASDLIFSLWNGSAFGEKMRLHSDGNLGIGTNSILSGNRLDVRGGNIMVGGFGGGTDYGLILTPDDGSGYWNIANVTGGVLTFNNSSTIGSSEQMRLTTTGLGIGTSPNQTGFGTDETVLTVKGKASGKRGILELIGLGNADNDTVGILSFMSQSATQELASIKG